MINKQALSGRVSWVLIGWLLSSAAPAQQRLTLADVWQSGMVVQRNQPITLWGTGRPGEPIRATFGREQRTATVAVDSSWSVTFSARPASAASCSVRVESRTEQIGLTDVLLGDVWICAGQSNMAFELKNDRFAPGVLPKINNPLLRLLNRRPALTTYKAAYKPAERGHLLPDHFYQPARWQPADSVSARSFSAVAYYAGQRVQQRTGIPIGLIHVAIGGSPTEAWLRPASSTGARAAVFTGNWLTNPALEPWCVERGHENLDSLLLAGYAVPRDSLGYNHPFKPGFLYAAAIQPLLRLGIAGILWYQGESNALSQRRVLQHEQLFPQLIADWRTDWQRPDLPVYFCQLSSIGTERGYKSEYWPLFRDSQRRMADSLPAVGMVVTSDVGHEWDVHPTDKKTVGERLAGEIIAGTYHQTALLSPSIKQVAKSRTGWTITFDYAGEGLQTADGQPVRGFSLGNETGPQTDISTTLLRQSIELKASNQATGTYLYYGWQPFSTANVVNSAGLPLSTFRLPLP
jgi:sialate O-acetylesterase